jgi:uncharacterized protein (DUF697 family)
MRFAESRTMFWDKVWKRLMAPTVDETALNERLHELKAKLPVPVFWLLGKTQSGKTSLIRALTRNSRAEIGSGIRPCTRTARVYDFPTEEDCLLRFLDTRGLGEVDYSPDEDLKQFQDQAHLLIVVLKAMDHAQQPVMEALQKIHKVRPGWPVLVVQTCLHEGYPALSHPHARPYPYGETPLPPSVPQDLARSLLKQREMFADAKIEATFVPVDLTLPEDGFEPADYGLEALWTAIEEMLPLGLRGILEQLEEARKSLRDLQYRAAHPHIVSYALAAGAAAGVPVPMVDIPLLLGIQAKMFHTIASIYHQEMNTHRMKEILSTLGIGYLGRLGGREMLKFIPGFSAIAAVYAGACTYAMGLTLCAFFSRSREGVLPDKAEFQKIYDEHFHEGREKLHTYLEQLRRREPKTP